MSNQNSHIDSDAWDDLTDRYIAANERGDEDTMREIAGQIKISPGMALAALQNWGKKRFLSLGYDLSYANSQLGEGWLDRYGS